MPGPSADLIGGETFATRFHFRTVLIGITIVAAGVHLVLVAIGGILGVSLPMNVLNISSGRVGDGNRCSLGKALPGRVIRVGAAILFFIFAGLLLIEGLTA